MRKAIVLACIFALLSPIAFATEDVERYTLFEPLSISGYTVKIPAGVVLPDRDVLQKAETRIHPMNHNIILYLYRHPEKRYADERGLVYPYAEMTITDKTGTHLLVLSFINDKMEIELFENRAAFGDSQNDEMMRITGINQPRIREIK